MKIRRGDIVKIITGSFKGKSGKVLKVIRKMKIQIENIGFNKKHLKPRTHKKKPEGGIIEQPSYINISNVLLFSSQLNRGVRVGCKIDEKSNTKLRESRGSKIPTITIDKKTN